MTHGVESTVKYLTTTAIVVGRDDEDVGSGGPVVSSARIFPESAVPITSPGDGILAGAPAVVLVEPSNPQNIGAVCRAMMNCGLTDLRLVRPCAEWNDGSARAMAVSAKGLLESARVFETTAAAIGDCTHVFATTARPRDMVIPEMTARRAAVEIRALASSGATVAVMFGAERTGLQNEDVAMSNYVVTIPLNPGLTSLNLAQAVLLVSYEWLQAGMTDPGEAIDPTEGRMPARKEQLDAFFDHIEQELGLIGFFPNQDMRGHMMSVIRAWVTRTKPTDAELRMLHGVLSTISGRRLGGKPAHVPGTKGGQGYKARKRRSLSPCVPEDSAPAVDESGKPGEELRQSGCQSLVNQSSSGVEDLVGRSDEHL